jgi:hypothetical protein
VGNEKDSELMYQIVLGMSNQILTTHLSRIVHFVFSLGARRSPMAITASVASGVDFDPPPRML